MLVPSPLLGEVLAIGYVSRLLAGLLCDGKPFVTGLEPRAADLLISYVDKTQDFK